jgi:acyl-CoA synthetase (AMP-forming)/AMP-acid ligase II
MVVVAEVVPREDPQGVDGARVRDEVLSICERNLQRYKIPMRITFVTELPMTPAGKLARDEIAAPSRAST